jgi:hypothetical protein
VGWVPKGSRRLAGRLDELIISLYAGGMTVRDIDFHLERTLGVQLSRDTISKITDGILSPRPRCCASATGSLSCRLQPRRRARRADYAAPRSDPGTVLAAPGRGWRFFATENSITRLIAVLESEIPSPNSGGGRSLSD